jgi:hypothetical protein
MNCATYKVTSVQASSGVSIISILNAPDKLVGSAMRCAFDLK